MSGVYPRWPLGNRHDPNAFANVVSHGADLVWQA
jgi:hypothetical protein